MLPTNFHDGYVTGIAIKGKDIEISVETVGRRPYKLRLEDVSRLICDDFRQGNVILDVEIVTDRRDVEGGMRRLLGGDDAQFVQIIHRDTEKVMQGDLVLLRIAPSYGCELIALCRRVHVTANDKAPSEAPH